MAETSISDFFVATYQVHSQLVAAKHYLQVRDEDYAIAAGQVAPQVAPQTHESGETLPQRMKETREKRSVFRGLAESFADMQSAGMGLTGLEPVRKTLVV